ncbi:MAG: hypothetical protein PHC70_01725 [Patescibacteria group bacterium]|nr:hypothetical protein [Patescibacteria group bacterium]
MLTWDELRFNTKFAWENPFLKWLSIVLAVILIAVSIIATVRLIQLGLPSGYVVTHYTVYLGIDQMLPLPWVAALLCVPILVIFGTILLGFTLFRQDSLAGYALLVLAATSTVIWSVFLYYLIKINT